MGARSILVGLIIAQTICLAIYIPAIIYGQQDVPSCATAYSGLSFDYAKWLLIFGWINVAKLGAMVLLLGFDLCKEGLFSAIGLCLQAVLGVFELAWFIIGAVLLFSTLGNSDCHGESLWKLGLAVFILETIHSVSTMSQSKFLSQMKRAKVA